MVEKITAEQIRDAWLAKDAKKCADLMYNYIEQNPDIKQKIVEKMVAHFVDGLVDYRDVSLGDAMTFTVKKRGGKNEKDDL